ncbi:MAG: substrate-binding protein [Thermodesulfobacteriota bacterium]|nr:substrate-binding protein [Thermodesulfobacteriota bacterium]
MCEATARRKGLALVLALVMAPFLAGLLIVPMAGAEVVKIGLNYPKTGPYSVQGLDQWRATEVAVDEINGGGGILGKKIEIVWRDSMSKADVTTNNVAELIDKEGVKMVFGGSASSVAVAAGKVCQEKGVPFFGTLTYSTATTGKEGRRHTFRECYNAWMGAKAIASYLNQNFKGKKYFYITADYTWGWTTEASVRKFSNTEDTSQHKGMLTPFPGASEADFRKALSFAKMLKPDVLVLVLFGKDMSTAIRLATAMGLKKDMQIVVPNLTLGMAEGGGPKVMEGVIGALPWTWKVPYKYDYGKGKGFVETFSAKYDRYPSTSGASAYTILYEYKAAVERAGTFDAPAVIKALEGHAYTLLKDKQVWRDFDHQSVQTVYAVKCNAQAAVLRDKYKLDYFEILSSLPGDEAVRTREEWNAVRTAAGKPAHLEKLPGEM